MQRREFLGAAMLHAGAMATAHAAKQLGFSENSFFAAGNKLKPMDVGVLIRIGDNPEEPISRVKQLGLNNCFLSLDHHIGKFTPQLAEQIGSALQKYGITATTAEVVGPGRLVWDFEDGPSTIGLVPRESRAARLDALKQTSDFAKLLGVPQIQTHCGFIPENPRDPLYNETVMAIREITLHCANNGQHFLMETGQETPTTMSRAIKDVNHPNLGVGLDTANLILYGKANPVDAVDIIGPHVRSIHAKDGKWPTNPMKLGEEVLIGTGLVDFEKVFTRLHKLGYTGAVTIEREIEGAQQMEDIRKEKVYLQRIINKVQSSNS